jgi:predicted PurR-regulated permease PerM
LEAFSNSDNLNRLNQVTLDVQQYIWITTLINAITGILNMIFLWIVGVDFAVLWGIMTWLFGYIPIIGFWIPLIPPVLLAWAEFGLPMAIFVFAVIALINVAAENFIKPRVMGESLEVSPLVIFVSLVFWGWVLGAAGAILAVPLTLLVTSILDSFEGTRWMTALIRVAPVKEGERKEAYQRLRGALDKAGDLWRGSEENETSDVDHEGEEKA